MKRVVAAGVLVAACAAGGCASGAFDSDRPYQQIYLLAGVAPRTASGAQLPVDLMVAEPQVRPGLDTDRIATLYPDRRLDYFAGSRWGGPTDRVVQSVLVESLRNAGGLRSVHGDAGAFTADFVLYTEIMDFQAEYAATGAAPQAHVHLVVTLGRFADRQPIASFVTEARVPAESNTLGAVVAAFDKALQQAAGEVVELTRAGLERSRAQAP